MTQKTWLEKPQTKLRNLRIIQSKDLQITKEQRKQNLNNLKTKSTITHKDLKLKQHYNPIKRQQKQLQVQTIKTKTTRETLQEK